MSYEAKNPVGATQRSFDVVETLRELDGARLTTLAVELDLPNSTVHNHLSTLMELGYVVKTGDTYRLSLKFLELGEYTRSLYKIHRVARPELKELATETGEAASLMVEENGMGVFLFSAAGHNALPLDTDTGTQIHLHASGLGKAILAHLSDERVETVIGRHGLPAYTDETITDAETLRSELTETRERGVAVDDEERVTGARSVAAPIKNDTGQIVGSVGISGPGGRLSDARIDELSDTLHDVTNVVELKLIYS